jgi:glycosyltransferase involved in cell wall biosynthesis
MGTLDSAVSVGGDRLKIWLQSSAFLPTPPPSTGGLETVVAELAATLATRGHDVTLFGLKGSAVAGVRVVTVPAYRRPYSTETAIVDKMEAIPRPDVLFDHSLYQLAQARWRTLPAVTQSHGEAKLSEFTRNPVFCSANHGRWHGYEHPEVALINVRPETYTVGRPMAERGPALFLGRLLPYKRVHLAIALCKAAGVPLTIAGPIAEPNYFHAFLEPEIQGNIQYIGEVGGADKVRLLAHSRCLMFTSEPQEPSGTVMLEAMAAGTPVFAFDHGANPEYVDQGRTGFLFRDEAEFKSALASRAWLAIDPAECRRHVEAVFSPERSADRAESFLRRAIQGERW